MHRYSLNDSTQTCVHNLPSFLCASNEFPAPNSGERLTNNWEKQNIYLSKLIKECNAQIFSNESPQTCMYNLFCFDSFVVINRQTGNIIIAVA